MSNPTIEDIAKKLANNFPAFVTDEETSNNLVRNKTFATLYMEIYNQIQQMKDDMTIKRASGDVPFMIGIENQPKSITGIRFFWIDKKVLINTDLSIRNHNRSHNLILYYDTSGTPFIKIDTGVQVAIEETGLYKVFDADSLPYYLLIDVDKIPSYDVEETYSVIPVYSTNYLNLLSYFYGQPKWSQETNDQYRARLLNFVRNGMVSKNAITSALLEYGTYANLTITVTEYREHYGSYFVIGRSFNTNFKGNSSYPSERKYVKHYSNNINYIKVDVNPNFPINNYKQITNDLEFLIKRMTVQGTRYTINFP